MHRPYTRIVKNAETAVLFIHGIVSTPQVFDPLLPQVPADCSLMCLLLPLSIETCQLFIQRMTDVDDLLLNFAGGMIGGGLFALVHMVFPKFTDKALVRG